MLVVNDNVPAKTIKEFIDYVKRNPGKVSYGSAGPGSLTHMTMELFKQETGAFMLHIPYRGIAPAITDLLGGQTQAMFPGLAAALPHLRSGRMRALAVTGTQRNPQLKDVPTHGRGRASRGSTRCSGTARSVRRACRPTSSAASTRRRSRC